VVAALGATRSTCVRWAARETEKSESFSSVSYLLLSELPLLLLRGGSLADARFRSDLPANRMTGSILLTVLALSDDNLLAALRASQILQRVELSLHSCKMFTVQDDAWLPALRAVHDLQQVLTSLVPVGPSMVEPYTAERVLRVWRDLASGISVLRGPLT
jgi:hypothetical protein